MFPGSGFIDSSAVRWLRYCESELSIELPGQRKKSLFRRVKALAGLASIHSRRVHETAWRELLKNIRLKSWRRRSFDGSRLLF